MNRTIRIELAYSDAGCPLFEPSDGAGLVIERPAGGSPADKRQGREVHISGNRQGLIALASAMLALAESTDPGHHLHIDDLHEHVVRSPEGIWLTISKLPEAKL